MAAILALGLLVAQVAADDDVPFTDLPDPHMYLYESYPSLAARLDCMIMRESSWNQWAQNGKYAGLAQFDYPTWMETPQGQAGQSRYDPYAAIDAMAWGVVHLGFQRWPITSRRC